MYISNHHTTMSLDNLSNAIVHIFILLEPTNLYNIRLTNKSLKYAIDSNSKKILENKWTLAEIRLNITSVEPIQWYKLLRFMYLQITTLPTVCQYLRNNCIDHDVVFGAGRFKLDDRHLDSKIIGSGIDTVVKMRLSNPNHRKLFIRNAFIGCLTMSDDLDTIEITNCIFNPMKPSSIYCQHAIITRCTITTQMLHACVTWTFIFSHNILINASLLLYSGIKRHKDAEYLISDNIVTVTENIHAFSPFTMQYIRGSLAIKNNMMTGNGERCAVNFSVYSGSTYLFYSNQISNFSQAIYTGTYNYDKLEKYPMSGREIILNESNIFRNNNIDVLISGKCQYVFETADGRIVPLEPYVIKGQYTSGLRWNPSRFKYNSLDNN